ncbi:MAG: response regulator, partial [Gammaproteobacteria bacterium]|nr:response regulator [Gammaproteobacteria bacterium]
MNQAAFETGTLLIVDDVPTNLKILLNYLDSFHLQVRIAQDGEEALEQVAYEKPDIILLDVMMPHMDGFEVCRRLKADKNTSDIPVIFMSALSDTVDKVKGFEIGGVDYVTKPADQQEVLARISTHLTLLKQKRQIHQQNKLLEQRVRERTKALHESRIQVVRSLGRAAEYRDNETGMHIIRMSSSAALLAGAMGMNEQQCEMLLHASPMHDVGKIGIPDAILLKPGPLSPDEWQVMQTHTLIGEKILSTNEAELLQTAALIARTHHEKWDGSGYPAGLKGEEIPTISRIVAICDVFDALTSKRPYKEAWKIEDTLAYMKTQAGKHFAPDILRLFLERFDDVLAIRTRYPDSVNNQESGVRSQESGVRSQESGVRRQES